ncbi:MAG: hypothetical protein IT290_13375 [Deltaproteobacteria bacterium]|nr:hypothetical protein [Deltaproteobacteria bacterium]
MFAIHPQKFIVPGIFLVVLGLGNVIVGRERAHLHREVIQELSALEPLPDLVSQSPLMRLQLKRLSLEKFYQRQRTAEARLDFYILVELGGKIFSLLGLTLLCAGGLARAMQSPETFSYRSDSPSTSA